MNEDSVYFCGLRHDGRFYHCLYVGANVGVIKRSKAQMQKNAAFNAMPGARSDIDLQSRDPQALFDSLS